MRSKSTAYASPTTNDSAKVLPARSVFASPKSMNDQSRSSGSTTAGDCWSASQWLAARGHDFGEMPVLPRENYRTPRPNDQTQSGGLDEEMVKDIPPASIMEPTETLEKENSLPRGSPVIDSVELVTSAGGAAGSFEAIACDANLNQPGPFNDHWFSGAVANVHQVHFHLSQGWPGDLRAKRIVNRKATMAGQPDTKVGDDGPPEHEFAITKDKLVIADAPGFCSRRREDSFPSTYSADFSLYAYDPLDKKILASISYHVEISKTSFFQIDPVNTVTVTDKKVGSGVASPVPKKN
jgi:hypothetical protein